MIRQIQCSIILLVSAFCTAAANNAHFIYDTLNFEYKGVAASGSTILCYSNSRYLTVSRDDGKNWKNIKVGDDSTVLLKAVCSSSQAAVLDVDGNLWLSDSLLEKWTRIQLPASASPKGLVYASGYYYVACSHGVFKIDSLGTLVDSTTYSSDEVIEINASRDLLFVSLAGASVDILNIQSFQRIKTASLKSSLQCDTCASVSNFRLKTTGEIIFRAAGMLWTSSDTLQTCDALTLADHPFELLDDTLFTMANAIVDFPLGLTYAICQMAFDGSWQNVTMDNSVQSYTRFVFILGWTVKGKDSIVAIADYHTILLSKDRGRTWEVISNISPGTTVYWVDKTTGFASGTQGGRVFATRDGGVTWRPQKYDTIYNTPLSQAHTMYADSLGFVIAANDYHGFTMISRDFGEHFKRVDVKNWPWIGWYLYAFDSSDCKVLFTSSPYHYTGVGAEHTARVVINSSDSLLNKRDDQQDSLSIIYMKARNGVLEGWFVRKSKFPQIYHKLSYDMGYKWEIKDSCYAPILSENSLSLNRCMMLPGDSLIAFVRDSAIGETWEDIFEYDAVHDRWTDSIALPNIYGSQVTSIDGYQCVCAGSSQVPLNLLTYYYPEREIRRSSSNTDTVGGYCGVVYADGERLWLSISSDYKKYYVVTASINREISAEVADKSIGKSDVTGAKPLEVVLFPNPVDKYLTLQVSDAFTPDGSMGSLHVFNIRGEQVSNSCDITCTQVRPCYFEYRWNCQEASSGMYILSYEHNGNKVSRIALVRH